MKVLIVGGGGREHALGYKVAESPLVNKIYFAPGNGGTKELGENIPIAVDDIDKLAEFAQKEGIDLTIVGPELPLSLGIVDTFNEKGLTIFGPDKKGAQLESSKTFSKEFMKKYEIPTGDFASFSDLDKAIEYLRTSSYPIVVKADGLAAGKGVLVCNSFDQAEEWVNSIMEDKIFGGQGSRVVIEEFLEGPEVSLLCLTDSKTIRPLASASDYKRAFDDNKGLNTGGMGSISPSFYYKEGSCDYIADLTLKGIQAEGFNIKGVVYIGLMLTENGPKVLEYNMRFGDPETQALIVRLESDIVDVINNIMAENLEETPINWSGQSAVTVVMASKGYPNEFEKGCLINLPKDEENVIVFHSATKKVEDKYFSDGGRVLAVTALGENLEKARETCYNHIDKIDFENGFYRKDIGVE